MKIFFTLTLAVLFSISTMYTINAPVYAQTGSITWEKLNEGSFEVKGNRRIIPQKYQVIKTNFENLKSVLRSSPFERSERALTSPFVIELPMPDGSFSKFIVTEYSMMETELSARFPDIKTYNLKGIDDPYATGKLDFTMLGFHGMILTPNGDVFIDPYSTNETEIYISYKRSDYFSKIPFECLTPQGISNDNNIINEVTATGQQLRTYRLACAATGEYTAYFGGTAAQGQAAIVTAINRVNGVYEKDFSVRMTLVANNINIVYTNSGTDPYTNNDGFAMLSQNQSNLDNVIGSGNYDIGHVFSTGGGGVAGLGVVCIGGSKANGVTGSPSPVGDPFYIDYVAHEMGHQFGGNHSFNSVTSNCGGGNRNGSTAWEPGSGSTIMAYAGICGADDLQPNSDAYFHSGSVSEIVSYTQSGSGNSCPVTTNTGNTPPSVTVPSGGFSIPISTPFTLTGSATDVENPGTLTYCWEEFDVGPAGSPGSPSGNAPIFRSFSPVTSPSRTFPKLSDLLNNSSTIGEILPTYTRNLQFRLTVRDNNSGGGGINFGSLTFSVTSSAGPFLVTSPNTNVNWNSGVQQTVTWNVANTTASPVSCANVNILLSTDGGNTFPTTLASGTPNDGSQLVTLPGVNTTTARIKVQSVGNIFFDISNVNFQISNTSLPSITHTALGDQLKSNWPVTVSASVSSIFPLDSVWVVWYKNIVPNKKQFKLIFQSGTTYAAAFNSLNSDVAVGDFIYYKIFAQNNSAGHEKDSTAQYSFKITDGKLCEGFSGATFPPTGWSVSYSGTLYWTRNAVTSYGIGGSGSAKFDFWNAVPGTDQSLISLTSTATASGDSLKFDHAYAPYTDGSTDSLEILTSTNGGSTYSSLVRLWGNNSNGNLNTASQSSSSFTPSNSQWLTKKYALPVGTNKVRFRARSGYGNNLYLDSICVVNNSSPVPATFTVAVQGYYNTLISKLNMRDTVRFYLRNTASPYAIVDSGKTVIDSVSLSGTVTFANAPSGTYYIMVKHRNSVETWSKAGGESYVKGLAFSYNFTNAQSQAYGSNQILNGSKYCIYNGDVDRDYSVDLTDIVLVFNDAQAFLGGYIITDLTGDRFVDVSDILVAFNNSQSFVTRQAPPGALEPIVKVRNDVNSVIEKNETLRSNFINGQVPDSENKSEKLK